MTRRCGSASRRFKRKDRLEVQPAFLVYAAQFLRPDSSCSGYTCCLERLHIAHSSTVCPWRFGMRRAILITDQRTCFQIKTMRDFEKIFEIPCEELPFWIISIVKNESRIILRKNQRTVPMGNRDGFIKSIDDIIGYTELVDLFTRLPETYRSVLELKMLHGYSNMNAQQNFPLLK